MPKNIKPVNFLPAILLAICAFHVQQAHALCTLVCSCSVSVTSVAFGTYNVFSPTPLTGTGSVDVSCGGVAGLLVPDFIYNIGTTVLNGGISMVIFFFVNKIIFPEGEAKQA